MSSHNLSSGRPARNILFVSASRYLTGVSTEEAIKEDWDKEKAHGIEDLFNNVGFNIDPTDVSGTLGALQKELEGQPWDGILLGWCIRGHAEFTLLFEEVVAMCCEVTKSVPQTKLMFSTGPDNLVETVLRNFPVDNRV